jgi:predicted nucleotidyltransferase
MSIESFLEAVVDWAKTDARVTGLVLVGSHARGTARPDSDIDLVITSDVPQELLSDTSWTESFGAVISLQYEDYGRVTSLRVRYANGPEVEFGVTAADWPRLPLDPGTRSVLTNGARVL